MIKTHTVLSVFFFFGRETQKWAWKHFLGYFSRFFTCKILFSRPLFPPFLSFFTPRIFFFTPTFGFFSVFFTGRKFCFTGTFSDIFTGRNFGFTGTFPDNFHVLNTFFTCTIFGPSEKDGNCTTQSVTIWTLKFCVFDFTTLTRKKNRVRIFSWQNYNITLDFPRYLKNNESRICNHCDYKFVFS